MTGAVLRCPTARIALALLALAFSSGSFAAAAGAQEPAGDDRATLTPSEFEALYRARADSARMRFTPADVGFVTGMIAHHAQALIMADLAPRCGASPAVRTLAARILNAQQDEIATMQRWLADRGQPVPEVRIDGLDLVIETRGDLAPPGRDTHAAHREADDEAHAAHAGQAGHGQEHALMPGMLSRAQLAQLAAARGAEFDRLFLRGMIHHHAGAVTMVHDLFATDGAAQDGTVFKLASDIQVDQRTEIARMEQMLAALAGPARTD